MSTKIKMIMGGSLLGISLLIAAPTAGAAPPSSNWGQEVKDCNTKSCYPGNTNRGGYVRDQARDDPRADQGPGYAREIHDLANPGKSDPAPFR